MKKHLLLGLFLFASGFVGAQDTGIQITDIQTTGISVTGSGTVYGEPDVAVLELGVNIADEDLNAASTEADRAVRAVIAALSAAGVAEQDIRTAYYNVWREERYNNDNTPGAPLYRVSNTLNVTVRDVNQVGELLAASLDAGANAVNNVQYTFADPAALAARARELAVQDARAKARQLADLVGVTLGPVLMVSDASTSGGPVMPVDMARYSMAEGSVPVSGGQLSVSAFVSVRYGIQIDEP